MLILKRVRWFQCLQSMHSAWQGQLVHTRAWISSRSLRPLPALLGFGLETWFGATPTSLSQLDAVQRRAIRIIDLPEDDLISHQIQPLGTRREVGALTLFHRMYYGEAPELLCQLLPEHLQLDPRLRHSVRSHDLAVQIPRSNLVSHKRSFVPSAARIWNSLPEYIPSLEKKACFKKEVNRYLGDN